MNKIFKVKRNANGVATVCSEIAKSRTKGRVVTTALVSAGLMMLAGQASAASGGVVVHSFIKGIQDNPSVGYIDAGTGGPIIEAGASTVNTVGSGNSIAEGILVDNEVSKDEVKVNIVGADNLIYGTQTNILGDNNIVADKSIVVGSENHVPVAALVFGHGNKVDTLPTILGPYHNFRWSGVSEDIKEEYQPGYSFSGNKYNYGNLIGGNNNYLHNPKVNSGEPHGQLDNIIYGDQNVVAGSHNVVSGSYNTALADSGIIVGMNSRATAPFGAYSSISKAIKAFMGREITGVEDIDLSGENFDRVVDRLLDTPKFREVLGRYSSKGATAEFLNLFDPREREYVSKKIMEAAIVYGFDRESYDKAIADLASLNGNPDDDSSYRYIKNKMSAVIAEIQSNYDEDFGVHALFFGSMMKKESPVVIGSNSTADGVGALALGSVTSANLPYSVALGSHSNATIDSGIVGYLAGGENGATWKSTLAAVAVGDADKGITRQITGLAAGTQDTDAVNVAQLKAVKKIADEAREATNTGGNPLSVTYTDNNKNTVNLVGTDGTTITNVKDGVVAKDSKDAVNGGQLYDVKVVADAAKEQSDANKTAIDGLKTVVDNKADKSYVDSELAKKVDKSDLDTFKNELDSTAVKYDSSSKDTITLAGTDGTTITNVKDGVVAKDSKDAVNGGQLYDVKVVADAAKEQSDANKTAIDGLTTKVDTNTNDITTLKETVKTNGDNIEINKTEISKLKESITSSNNTINMLSERQDVFEGRLNGFENRMDRMEDNLEAGIAGANASAALPQVRGFGKSMMAFGMGGFRDKGAVAIGYSRSSDNGRTIFKAHLNADTEKQIGGGVGVGFEW